MKIVKKVTIIIGLLIISGAFEELTGSLWEIINLLYFLIASVILFIPSRGEIFRVMRNTTMFMMITGLAVISTLWSDQITSTLIKSIALIFLTIFSAYLVTRYSLRELLFILARLMIFIIISSIFFVIFLPQYGIGEWSTGVAWKGIFSNKGAFGVTMMISALIFLTLPTQTIHNRLFNLIFYALSIFLIWKTNSRLSLVIIILLTLGYYSLLLFQLSGPTIIAIITMLIIPITFGLGFTIINYEDILLSMGRDTTLTGRTVVWENVIYAISLRPILGYGYNGFWQNWDGIYGTIWSQQFSQWKVGSAHQTYLDVWLQLGVIGLILYVFILVNNIINSIVILIQNRSSVLIFIALYLICILIMGFVETVTMYITLFWTLFTIITFYIRNRELIMS